jgi:hypothetical protein
VPHRHPLVQQTKTDACAVMTGNVLDYGDVSVPPAAYASLRPGQWLLDPVLALECQCVHPAPPPPFTVTHRSVLRGQCVCLCTPLLLVATARLSPSVHVGASREVLRPHPALARTVALLPPATVQIVHLLAGTPWRGAARGEAERVLGARPTGLAQRQPRCARRWRPWPWRQRLCCCCRSTTRPILRDTKAAATGAHGGGSIGTCTCPRC